MPTIVSVLISTCDVKTAVNVQKYHFEARTHSLFAVSCLLVRVAAPYISSDPGIVSAVLVTVLMSSQFMMHSALDHRKDISHNQSQRCPFTAHSSSFIFSFICLSHSSNPQFECHSSATAPI